MKTETFFRNLKRETNKKHWKIKISLISSITPPIYTITRTYRNFERDFYFWKKWKTYRKSLDITDEAIFCLKNSSAIIPILIKQLQGRS